MVMSNASLEPSCAYTEFQNDTNCSFPSNGTNLNNNKSSGDNNTNNTNHISSALTVAPWIYGILAAACVMAFTTAILQILLLYRKRRWKPMDFPVVILTLANSATVLFGVPMTILTWLGTIIHCNMSSVIILTRTIAAVFQTHMLVYKWARLRHTPQIADDLYSWFTLIVLIPATFAVCPVVTLLPFLVSGDVSAIFALYTANCGGQVHVTLTLVFVLFTYVIPLTLTFAVLQNTTKKNSQTEPSTMPSSSLRPQTLDILYEHGPERKVLSMTRTESIDEHHDSFSESEDVFYTDTSAGGPSMGSAGKIRNIKKALAYLSVRRGTRRRTRQAFSEPCAKLSDLGLDKAPRLSNVRQSSVYKGAIQKVTRSRIISDSMLEFVPTSRYRLRGDTPTELKRPNSHNPRILSRTKSLQMFERPKPFYNLVHVPAKETDHINSSVGKVLALMLLGLQVLMLPDAILLITSSLEATNHSMGYAELSSTCLVYLVTSVVSIFYGAFAGKILDCFQRNNTSCQLVLATSSRERKMTVY